MTKQEIIDLIRECYDHVPRDWNVSEAKNWDDGTSAIADKITASIDHLYDQIHKLWMERKPDGAGLTPGEVEEIKAMLVKHGRL